MKHSFSVFRFGSSYYPLHREPTHWAHDLDQMVAGKFNAVRVGDFSWCRLEPAPGQYEFGEFITVNGGGNIKNTVTMQPGSSITYKATGKLSAAATGTVSDTANVTVPSGIADPNPGNNSATDSDTILLKADLKVTVTDGKASALPGSKNTYTIVVTNAGPSKVSGAIIRDTFPSTFTGVTYTATQSGSASGFTASGSGNISNTVTMPPASTITFKATGTISASATGSISDTATVTAPSGVTDPNAANNSATDTDTL